jgi:D-alanine-D-alanine ligase
MTSRFQNAKVGVLMGGVSAEREISLGTGRAMTEALTTAGYAPIAIDWNPAERQFEANEVDVVVLALHGGYGEDGSIQGYLNCVGIPYTGSGVCASALAMDKVRSKRIFEAAGLRTPAYHVLHSGEAFDPTIELPVVVKPAREGSSVGVTIVREPGELQPALEAAALAGGEVLLEAYVDGKELSVGIFDGEVLGCVEIIPTEEFYSFEAKYQSTETHYRLPPSVDRAVVNGLEQLARKAYAVLGCRGVARIDVMIDEIGIGWLLEVNTLPGMTGTSLVPKMAAARGESFPNLMSRILEAARTD